MAAKPARRQLYGGNENFMSQFAPENLVLRERQVRSSHPAVANSCCTPGPNQVLTYGCLSLLPLSATGFVHSVSNHQVSPEYIASNISVLIAVTAKSLPAQSP